MLQTIEQEAKRQGVQMPSPERVKKVSRYFKALISKAVTVYHDRPFQWQYTWRAFKCIIRYSVQHRLIDDLILIFSTSLVAVI